MIEWNYNYPVTDSAENLMSFDCLDKFLAGLGASFIRSTIDQTLYFLSQFMSVRILTSKREKNTPCLTYSRDNTQGCLSLNYHYKRAWPYLSATQIQYQTFYPHFQKLKTQQIMIDDSSFTQIIDFNNITYLQLKYTLTEIFST